MRVCASSDARSARVRGQDKTARNRSAGTAAGQDATRELRKSCCEVISQVSAVQPLLKKMIHMVVNVVSAELRRE